MFTLTFAFQLRNEGYVVLQNTRYLSGGINKKQLTECIWDISKKTNCTVGKFHILKSEDNDFGHIHLENENDAGTFFSKVRDGEFCVEGRPINFLASRQAGSKDPILYKIDEAITSTIEPPTILNEPTTSEPSISIENFKEFGTGRLVEFLRNDKNLSELKLDDNFFTKIMEGRTFLKLTKSDLRECGVRLGPSLELEEYIQELGVKKYL